MQGWRFFLKIVLRHVNPPREFYFHEVWDIEGEPLVIRMCKLFDEKYLRGLDVPFEKPEFTYEVADELGPYGALLVGEEVARVRNTASGNTLDLEKIDGRKYFVNSLLLGQSTEGLPEFCYRQAQHWEKKLLKEMAHLYRDDLPSGPPKKLPIAALQESGGRDGAAADRSDVAQGEEQNERTPPAGTAEPAKPEPKGNGRGPCFLTVQLPFILLGTDAAGDPDRATEPNLTHEKKSHAFYEVDSQTIAIALLETFKQGKPVPGIPGDPTVASGSPDGIQKLAEGVCQPIFGRINIADLSLADRVLCRQQLKGLALIAKERSWEAGAWSVYGLPDDRVASILSGFYTRAQEWEPLVRDELDVTHRKGKGIYLWWTWGSSYPKEPTADLNERHYFYRVKSEDVAARIRGAFSVEHGDDIQFGYTAGEALDIDEAVLANDCIAKYRRREFQGEDNDFFWQARQWESHLPADPRRGGRPGVLRVPHPDSQDGVGSGDVTQASPQGATDRAGVPADDDSMPSDSIGIETIGLPVARRLAEHAQKAMAAQREILANLGQLAEYASKEQQTFPEGLQAVFSQRAIELATKAIGKLDHVFADKEMLVSGISAFHVVFDVAKAYVPISSGVFEWNGFSFTSAHEAAWISAWDLLATCQDVWHKEDKRYCFTSKFLDHVLGTYGISAKDYSRFLTILAFEEHRAVELGMSLDRVGDSDLWNVTWRFQQDANVHQYHVPSGAATEVHTSQGHSPAANGVGPGKERQADAEEATGPPKPKSVYLWYTWGTFIPLNLNDDINEKFYFYKVDSEDLAARLREMFQKSQGGKLWFGYTVGEELDLGDTILADDSIVKYRKNTNPGFDAGFDTMARQWEQRLRAELGLDGHDHEKGVAAEPPERTDEEVRDLIQGMLPTAVVSVMAMRELIRLAHLYPESVDEQEFASLRKQLTSTLETILRQPGFERFLAFYQRPDVLAPGSDEHLAMLFSILLMWHPAARATGSPEEIEAGVGAASTECKKAALEPCQTILKRIVEVMIYDCRIPHPKGDSRYQDKRRFLALLNYYWSLCRVPILDETEALVSFQPHPLLPLIVNAKARIDVCFGHLASLGKAQDVWDTVSRLLDALLSGGQEDFSLVPEFTRGEVAKVDAFLAESRLLLGSTAFEPTQAEQAFAVIFKREATKYQRRVEEGWSSIEEEARAEALRLRHEGLPTGGALCPPVVPSDASFGQASLENDEMLASKLGPGSEAHKPPQVAASNNMVSLVDDRSDERDVEVIEPDGEQAGRGLSKDQQQDRVKYWVAFEWYQKHSNRSPRYRKRFCELTNLPYKKKKDQLGIDTLERWAHTPIGKKSIADYAKTPEVNAYLVDFQRRARAYGASDASEQTPSE